MSSNNHIYFDNAATTMPLDMVIEEVGSACRDFYGNPSSLHKMGIVAEQKIINARKVISSSLACRDDEVVFTSGGTESNNLAILGSVESYIKKIYLQPMRFKIITTAAEHPSVEEAFKKLEKIGFDVKRISLDLSGQINKQELLGEIDEATVLVSLIHVNNETGAICDIENIAKEIKAKNPNVIVHSDGVQAFKKVKINLKNIDFYSISSHKIHGLKGSGVLYIKKGTKILPQAIGGGQEFGMRSGTENVASISAFAVAAAAYDHNEYEKIMQLSQQLKEVSRELDDVFINAEGSPYILNMSFLGVKAEVLLHALEDLNIFVSTGSACSSRSKKKNILSAYGLPKERAESGIRFSFSRFNTLEEVEIVRTVLLKIVPTLRKVGRTRGF